MGIWEYNSTIKRLPLACVFSCAFRFTFQFTQPFNITIKYNIFLESIFKKRIDLIKSKCNKIVSEIKLKTNNSFKEMNDYLGERYIRENNSILHMCNYIKNCIELKQKIKNYISFDQDEFSIDNVIFLI